MTAKDRKIVRCAVYTRKSSEQGLEQDFNSLDAQRESAEAYIRSQAHEGWRLVKTRYDDGGLSGGTLERPALQSLLDDIRARLSGWCPDYAIVKAVVFRDGIELGKSSRLEDQSSPSHLHGSPADQHDGGGSEFK